MDGCYNFSKNIEAVRKIRKLNLCEFSKMVDTPISTLHHVLKGGHPTLDTALRIAGGLEIPLSTLTEEIEPAADLDNLSIYLAKFRWFRDLEAREQRGCTECFRGIVEAMPEEEGERP